jgi:hypothetical protein
MQKMMEKLPKKAPASGAASANIIPLMGWIGEYCEISTKLEVHALKRLRHTHLFAK